MFQSLNTAALGMGNARTTMWRATKGMKGFRLFFFPSCSSLASCLSSLLTFSETFLSTLNSVDRGLLHRLIQPHLIRSTPLHKTHTADHYLHIDYFHHTVP